MADKIYVVVGGTGNIGKEIALGLLKKGKKVRVLARTPAKLKDLADKGAETVQADLQDAVAVKKAFAGASAAFVMIPPNYGAPEFRKYQNQVGQIQSDAIAGAGITHVVDLSSVGGHLPERTGVITGLYDQEQRLNKLKDVNVVHLRPAFFMENHLFGIGTIKQMGLYGTPLKGDMPIPQISTRDIAAVAVDLLDKLDFSGKGARELFGPRDVSLEETTRVLGAAIGKKDLKYAQFPYADAEKAMVQMGMSADVARIFVEMYKGFNEGLIRGTQPRSPQTNTPTTIEQFAQTFAAAFNQQAEPARSR